MVGVAIKNRVEIASVNAEDWQKKHTRTSNAIFVDFILAFQGSKLYVQTD